MLVVLLVVMVTGGGGTASCTVLPLEEELRRLVHVLLADLNQSILCCRGGGS